MTRELQTLFTTNIQFDVRMYSVTRGSLLQTMYDIYDIYKSESGRSIDQFSEWWPYAKVVTPSSKMYRLSSKAERHTFVISTVFKM